MSIVCNECGHNIKSSAEYCAGCGAGIPEIARAVSALGASGNGDNGSGLSKALDIQKAMQPARCCPKLKCGDFLIEGDTEACGSCGTRVDFISVALWVRKVLRPTFDRDIVEAVYKKETLIRQAEEAGLLEGDAEVAFQRELQKLAKVTSDVFLDWFEQHVQPALYDQTNVEQIKSDLLREARDLKISVGLAERVVNMTLPRLGVEAEQLQFDASIEKTSTEIRIWNDGGGKLEALVSVSARCASWIEVHPVEIKTEKEKCSILISVRNVRDLKPGTHYGEVTVSSNGGLKAFPLSLLVGRPWIKKHKTKVEVTAALLSIPSILFTLAFLFKDPIVRWFAKPSLAAIRVYPGSNVREGETVTLKAEGLNTDPASLSYDWEIKPPSVGHIDGKGPEVTLTISAIDPAFSSAMIEVKLRVANKYGDSASQSTSMNVVRPLPLRQVPLEPMDHPVAISLGQRAKLRARVGDFDGDRNRLTYEWRCSAGRVEGTGNTVDINTSGLDRSVATIEVTLKVSSPQGTPGYDRALINILRPSRLRRRQSRPKPSDKMFVLPRPGDNPAVSDNAAFAAIG